MQVNLNTYTIYLHANNKQQMRFQAPSTSSRRRKRGRLAYLQENSHYSTEEDGEDKEKIIDILGRTQKKNRLT